MKCASCSKKIPIGSKYVMRYLPSKDESFYFCDSNCHDTAVFKLSPSDKKVLRCDGCDNIIDDGKSVGYMMKGEIKIFCNTICKDDYVSGNGKKLTFATPTSLVAYEQDRCKNCNKFVKYSSYVLFTTYKFCDITCRDAWKNVNPSWMTDETHFSSECDYKCDKHKDWQTNSSHTKCESCKKPVTYSSSMYFATYRFCNSKCRDRWKDENSDWMSNMHFADDCDNKCDKHRLPEKPEAVSVDFIVI